MLFGCQPNAEQGKPERSSLVETPSPKHDLLQKAWDAHGGMKDWQKMQQLAFSLYEDDELLNRQTIDLRSNKLLISSESYRFGYDGQQAWLKGILQAEPDDASIRNMHQQLFFFTMPFMLANEGVKVSTQGWQQLQGSSYQGLLVTFEQSIDVPAVAFRVYFDPDTHRMAWLITAADDNNEEQIARHYRDWQWVNGLLVPLTCEIFSWKGGTPGKIILTQQYLDVSLDALPVDQSMFLPPGGATSLP
jgi:hypothetical protein